MELQLEKRLEGMKRGRAQLQAQLNAFDGSIQTLQELITDRDKAEPVKAPEVSNDGFHS